MGFVYMYMWHIYQQSWHVKIKNVKQLYIYLYDKKESCKWNLCNIMCIACHLDMYAQTMCNIWHVNCINLCHICMSEKTMILQFTFQLYQSICHIHMYTCFLFYMSIVYIYMSNIYVYKANVSHFLFLHVNFVDIYVTYTCTQSPYFTFYILHASCININVTYKKFCFTFDMLIVIIIIVYC